jgi:hypothetical protein
MERQKLYEAREFIFVFGIIQSVQLSKEDFIPQITNALTFIQCTRVRD